MSTTEQTRLGRFLRDPLFHFLIAGAAIYIAYGMVTPADQVAQEDDKTVVVTAGEIEWLTSTWTRTWNRPPTEEELAGVIQQHVRETVLYREAKSMGLDQEDVVIRRRLGQKLEFLTQDMLQPEPPSDAELRAYFDDNIERYRAEDTLTMSQIFFDPDKRGHATLEDAEAEKARLISLQGAPVDIKAIGDDFMLQNYYPQITVLDLSKLFGSGFAEPVFELEPGVWHGPVLSGYGTHLVFIHQKTVQPMPEFEGIMEVVREDWLADKRGELNDQFIEALLDRYTVVIEEPLDTPDAVDNSS
jgi:hypothetical protein